MLWDYCRIFCLLLFGMLFLEASNEDHQPFGPGERPALVNLKKMETVYVDYNWGPIKNADVRQMEGYPAPNGLPYREALYPIKSSKYKQIALRSFVDGEDFSIYLSLIREGVEFTDCWHFTDYSSLGMLEAYEGSLNDDEHSDYVFIKHSGGNGLAWGHADVALLLSKDDGDFTVHVLNTYAPDPKDFITIGKETVFVHSSFQYGDTCTDGKYHNFWAYRLYCIKEDQLVEADHLHSNFPKVVWYSFKPNHEETTLLEKESKDEMIAESAMTFEEKAPELPFEWRSGVQHIKNVIATGDPDLIKDLFKLPFKISSTFIINDSDDMRDAIDYILDDEMIKEITAPGFENWSQIGWRGVCFKNGELWLGDTRNGLIFSTNYITEKGQRVLLEKKEEIQSQLHASVSKFERTKMDVVCPKYRYRIDVLEDESVRLVVWERATAIFEKPWKVIQYGKEEWQGSGGFYYSTFTSGDYEFKYEPPGGKDDESKFLIWLKGEQIHEGFTTPICLIE